MALRNGELKQLYKDRLVESGLSEDHGRKLKLELLESHEVAKLGFDLRPGIRIPYFTPSGSPTKFWRLRFLGEPSGFSKGAKKPPRYIQPVGTLNEVYFPPLLEQRWEEVLKNPKLPLYFTEGEFKSASGCSRGLPVIGLGGVDCFRASKRGFSELLPVLEDIEWRNREVAIIWDSDVGTKPEALAAQRKLAYELCRREALPRLVVLPSGPEGRKQGLDDYLLRYTAEDLLTLVESAGPWEEASELWGMNEEVVLVLHPSMLVVRRNGKLINAENFKNVNFAHRKIHVREGEKIKVKSLAKEWLEWPGRMTVESITYAPGNEQIIDGKWNAWTGFGVPSAKGDVRPFLELVNFVFRDAEPEAKKWFLQWCAYPIQYPGTKLFSAVVVWGPHHGTGKSFIGYILRDLYGENGIKIGDEELNGTYTWWAQNKQFIMGEEITGTDKRQASNKLKDLITGERVPINEKYLPSFTLPNTINFYFTSNEPNAFFLQDTDRRFFIHEVKGGPHPDGDAFYDKITAWRTNGGLSALRYYLENDIDVSSFRPKGAAFFTQAKQDMIVDNKSELGRWVYALKTDPVRALSLLGNAKAANECDLFTINQLFQAFNPANDPKRGSINGLSRELKAAEFYKAYKGQSIQTKLTAQKLWIVRNTDKWIRSTGAECARHWESFYGTGRVGKF